jgi:hypothetical protein
VLRTYYLPDAFLNVKDRAIEHRRQSFPFTQVIVYVLEPGMDEEDD